MPAQREKPGAHETGGGIPSAVPDIEDVQGRREVRRSKLPDKRQAGNNQPDQQRLPQNRLDLDSGFAAAAVSDIEARSHRGEHQQQRVRQDERPNDNSVVQLSVLHKRSANDRSHDLLRFTS